MTGETDPIRALSRRRFLAGIGAITTVVASGVVLDVWGRSAPASAARVPRLSGHAGRTVVFLELAGGNDGLDTVVPYADAGYRRLRPTLAIDNPIDLDGSVGLHPNLVRLAEHYRAGHVAIVEGVSYPDNDLSHFASLATWWSGQPGTPGTTGWLGRFLDATVGFDDPLAAVTIGPGPSPALVGERSFATSISDAGGLEPRVPAWVPRPDDLVDAWADFAPRTPDRSTLTGRVRERIRLTARARAELDRALQGGGGADDAAITRRAYEGGASVTEAFDLAARLVTGEHPPKVVYITNLGDYDTHQGQVARHGALMADLDAGIDRLLGAVQAAGVADRVILVTLSEFGRRAQENGSGTDHGNASAHFVIGTRVKGGRYGRPTSLANLDSRGNLPFAVDFRSLYATALEGWLGVDAAPILGKGFAPQPIFT